MGRKGRTPPRAGERSLQPKLVLPTLGTTQPHGGSGWVHSPEGQECWGRELGGCGAVRALGTGDRVGTCQRESAGPKGRWEGSPEGRAFPLAFCGATVGFTSPSLCYSRNFSTQSALTLAQPLAGTSASRARFPWGRAGENTLEGALPVERGAGKITESSSSDRMVWVGRDLIDHLVPTPCHGQGHLPPAQGAPSPVQPWQSHGRSCCQPYCFPRALPRKKVVPSHSINMHCGPLHTLTQLHVAFSLFLKQYEAMRGLQSVPGCSFRMWLGWSSCSPSQPWGAVFTESSNNRWFGWEGTVEGHPVQRPCREQGHLHPDQGAQSPVQPGLEWFQGWGIPNLSGQPGPGSHHPQRKQFFP